jgi:hypothetical protein
LRLKSLACGSTDDLIWVISLTKSPFLYHDWGFFYFMITLEQYNEAKAIVKEYEKQNTTEHWKELVDFWFEFYTEKKGYQPTFTPRDSKALKEINKNLKAKATEKGFLNWDKDYCLKVFNHFLNLAYSDNWLSENFLLSNLNSKFDSIISKNNGKTKPTKGIDATNALNLLTQFTKQ